jgi:hypothetical protein
LQTLTLYLLGGGKIISCYALLVRVFENFALFPPGFFCRLCIYISNLGKINIARLPMVTPTIPPIDGAFFMDELAAGDVEVEDGVALVAVVRRVGFRVSWGKYSSGLNACVASCEELNYAGKV